MKTGKTFLPVFLFSIILLVFSFSSCSLTFEKRHYRKGYHIEIVKNEVRRTTVTTQPSKDLVKVQTPYVKSGANNQPVKTHVLPREQVQPSSRARVKETMPLTHKKIPVNTTSHTIKRGSDCDLIILKDGMRMEVIVENIGEDDITYRKCGFESGPSYTMSLSKVEKVELRNGDYYKPLNINNKAGKGGNGTGEMVVSILAFIFSLFAFVMCFLGFSYGAVVLTGVFGSFGFILGIFGLVYSSVRMNPENKNRTIPGAVLGGLAILIFMIAITFLAFL